VGGVATIFEESSFLLVLSCFTVLTREINVVAHNLACDVEGP
jgi:hypothetical protein